MDDKQRHTGRSATDYPGASEIERDLLLRYGPILSEDEIWRALRYPSKATFRKALSRGLVVVATTGIRGRRGRFARTRDVARWWEEQLERSNDVAKK